MDLKQFDLNKIAEEGVTFTLLHPNGEEFDLPEDKKPTITVAGRDSETFRAADKEEKAKLNAMSQKQRNKVDMDYLRKQSINILVKCVLGWTNIEENGKAVPCNATNKNRILRDPGYAWIMDQVEEHANDRAKLFLGK